MDKKFLVNLTKYMPLGFVILATIFMVINFMTIEMIGYGLGSYIFGEFSPSLRLLLSAIILLSVGGSVAIIFSKKTLNTISIVLLIMSISLIILWPQIHSLVTEQVASLGWGAIVGIVFIGLALVMALREFFLEVKFTIREMVEMAILVALAIVFDYIPKIRVGATGGSISLTMLPLFIIAFRFNFVKSFIASGIIYGLITCLTDGYGFATYPFDYLLGFGLISLASLFRKIAISDKYPYYLQYIFFGLGVLVGGFSRFIGATLSSMIIYQTTLWGGITYNATYIIPSVAFSLVILLLLFPLLKRLQVRYSLSQ